MSILFIALGGFFCGVGFVEALRPIEGADYTFVFGGFALLATGLWTWRQEYEALEERMEIKDDLMNLLALALDALKLNTRTTSPGVVQKLIYEAETYIENAMELLDMNDPVEVP